ncbi:MAG: flagellar biosynthesis protein FlhB [Parvibaculaceae bacterium]
MAETPDDDSKTEEATERRIDEALRKGNVPFSREAPVFASMAGMIVIAVFLLRDSGARLVQSLQQFLENPAGWSFENHESVLRLFQISMGDVARFLLPLVAVLGVTGLVASLFQTTPRVAGDRVQPESSRLSLLKGWKRIFGLQGHVEFLKACFKFAAISVVAAVILRSEQQRIVNAMFVEPSALPELILTVAMKVLSAVCVATIVLVAADLVWARVSWRRNLRMTRQEVKDEMKQTEGDPLVKARLKSLARDRLRKRMIASVPKATLVIVNPTHYAVALRYNRDEGGAPLVLAKGKDLIALKIRQIAEDNEIPVIEDKPLARSLYDVVEIDRMIPPEFYRAVAEILYLVMSGKRGSEARA